MTRKTAILDKNAYRPSHSVFVAANAGAGKTSLLTRRVLGLLLHGVEPSRILCLTFTNAASAEMRSRVLQELGRWVMADTAQLQSSLSDLLGHAPDERLMQRARSLFATVLEAGDGLRIQTIHGLCQSLLRRFSLESGVNPHFRVMDTRTSQEMLHEARLRLYAHAQGHDPALREALREIALETGEQALTSLFSQLVQNKQKLQSLFRGAHTLEAALAQLWNSCGLPDRPGLPELIKRYFTYDPETLRLLQQTCRTLSLSDKKTDNAMASGLARWLEQPGMREGMASEYIALFMRQDGLPRQKIHTKEALGDSALSAALHEEQRRVEQFDDAFRSLRIARRSAHLMIVAEGFLSLYEHMKRSRAAIDYDDMILACLRLLEQSGMAAWVLFKLDGGIDHVLVDESQDTSPLQWRIVAALTGEFFAGQGRSEAERSLFIVGDEKQSIYSFQGADLRALTQMQEYFSQRIADAGMPFLHLGLTHSYRSAPQVLTVVDHVFSHKAGQGVHTAAQPLAHIPTRNEAPGLVELWPLITPGEDDVLPVSVQLAGRIADTISGWLKEGCALPSRNRPVQAGDILVLVRKRTGFVDTLVRSLKRRGVPVAGIDRLVLGDNLAIKDLLALTQSVLLPEDDLSLAAALKSPIFNLSEDELFALAHGRGTSSLWQRMSELPAASEAYSLLSSLRALADTLPPYEFFSYILDEKKARHRIIGRMGNEYLDPLDEFLSQSLTYQQSHVPSLQGFLSWFLSSESEIKRDMEQAGSAVRIMTVHGAKGLQAPIVILPDTTTPPMMKETFLWETQGLELPLWIGSKQHDNRRSAALRQEQRSRMLEEYNRLLYVALTRAEDRLYICGACSDKKPGADSWYELVRPSIEELGNQCEMTGGEGWRLGEKPAEGWKLQKPIQSHDETAFPYLFAPAPAEPLPTHPLSPSALSSEDRLSTSPVIDKTATTRGKLIHTLLQCLPKVEAAQRLSFAGRLAQAYTSTLPQALLSQAIEEVLSLLSDERHAFLFGPHSLEEVPVIGNVAARGEMVTVSGQIDRLYIGGDGIWIVDFKTSASTARIPASYVRQLALYRLLIEQIYPGRPVTCALLWTADAAITVLDEAAMAPYI